MVFLILYGLKCCNDSVGNLKLVEIGSFGVIPSGKIWGELPPGRCNAGGGGGGGGAPGGGGDPEGSACLFKDGSGGGCGGGGGFRGSPS